MDSAIACAVQERLLELCRRDGITVNKMCTRAAVPQSSINNFMNQKTHSIGIINLKKLIDSFDMTITEFFDAEVFRTLEQELK